MNAREINFVVVAQNKTTGETIEGTFTYYESAEELAKTLQTHDWLEHVRIFTVNEIKLACDSKLKTTYRKRA